MTAPTYQAHAPAKINLALHVIGQRPDGYHDLDSLVVFARTGDVVRMEVADTDSFSISGEFAASLDTGEDNSVLRAKAHFQRAFPEVELPPLAIELQKNLPVASGIGGGSADAAATLALLATITGVEDDPRLGQVAAQLGADVPMCLSVDPKRIAGVGDQVEIIDGVPPCHALLVNPLKPVSTPQAFAQLTQRRNPPLPEFKDGWDGLEDLASYLKSTRNDLRQASTELVPEIADIEQILGATDGCHFARMSGSGATVFGLFATKDDAQRAEAHVRQKRPSDWISIIQIYGSSKVVSAQ